jgi:predicted SPOUT superfamily RNA methylase MTH1
MERVGKSLSKLKLSGNISTEELARAAWPVAVGKRIALRAVAVSMVRDKLVVEVEDAIWQKQLWGLRVQILKSLDDVIGAGMVRDLEFRVAIQRRPPQTATQLTPLSTDDADRIEDNVLRMVYKQARKKATA